MAVGGSVVGGSRQQQRCQMREPCSDVLYCSGGLVPYNAVKIIKGLAVKMIKGSGLESKQSEDKREVELGGWVTLSVEPSTPLTNRAGS